MLVLIVYCNIHTKINTEKARRSNYVRGPHVARVPVVGPRLAALSKIPDLNSFKFQMHKNIIILVDLLSA